jgi:methyl-accepting chemotaxis protein
MKSNLKLGLVIRSGFAGILLVTIAVGVTNKFITDQLIDAKEWVVHTYEVLGDLEKLRSLLTDAETGQRGFLLTQQDSYLEPYTQALQDIDTTIEALGQQIADNPEQVSRLDELDSVIDRKLAELAQTIRLQRAGRREETLALVLSGEGQEYMDEIRDHLNELSSIEQDLLAEREQRVANLVRLANLSILIATVGAIAFGICVLIFIQQRVIQVIQRIARSIATSAAEIAVTVEQQERATTQQATSVNETTTSMDEMSASARQSAEQTDTAAEQARQALGFTADGTHAVERTLQGMNELQQSVSAIAAQIRQLNEQANRIGTISGVVSDLANQTNVLALNASIEAVRAGEGGKGFSVVAAEIRKLANESKLSAEQISSLVGAIQQAVDATDRVAEVGTQKVTEGVKIATETEQTFVGVAEAVNGVVVNNQQIALNVQQQSSGIAQVVAAMRDLNQAARETANGVTQIRGEIQQLSAAAETLQKLV